MNYQKILTTDAWVPYIKHFERENILLKYPESLVFTVQLINSRLEKFTKDVYPKFPLAEKFPVDTMNSINWDEEIYLFDTNFRMLRGPEPVVRMENLFARLASSKAQKNIFSMNPPVIKNFKLVVIISIFAFVVHTVYRSLFPSDHHLRDSLIGL